MEGEKIVMTPSKKGRTTCIRFEKVKTVDEGMVQHVGGGEHAGLVINKAGANSDPDSAPQLQLEFKCFLVDNKSGGHVPESRVLKFWFAPETDYLDKVTGAYEFFKELVKPDSFPRDYVGFIKRIMKQLEQPKYTQVKKVGIDLTQLDAETEGPPPSPDAQFRAASGALKEDTRPKEVIVQEQLLLTLESAYPNILPMEDLSRMTGMPENMIQEQLSMLQGKDLIREMEPGKWVRKVLDEQTEVKVVQQMATVNAKSKPTIGIISSKYYEKLAVDAMMEDKTTFVKYKTEGESNVYTIGVIGNHRVVSTKLPMIGRDRSAQISAGSTTTRLLGTFGDIDYVFLVGVAGGVPHYTDFYSHPRLGDVLVSTPNEKGFVYIYCDHIDHDAEQGTMHYTLKSWSPQDLIIQKVVQDLVEKQSASGDAPWEKYIEDGQVLLQNQQVDFSRPPADTDRLYMNIGGNDVIEVQHPSIPEGEENKQKKGVPVIRQGAYGSGKPIISNDPLRLDFAARYQCAGFDTEFDQVLESIVGNRKDSFCFIRGLCDYLDGTKNTDWQPYSALASASLMKAIINNLPPPS